MNTLIEGIENVAASVADWLSKRPVKTEDPGEMNVEDPAVQADLSNFIAGEIGRLLLATPPRVTVVPSRRISTGQTNVRTDDQSPQLIGFQPDRIRIHVHNPDGSNSVWIGPDHDTANASSGFEIEPGTTAVFETQAALFARSVGGEISVQYLIEYGD